MTAKSAVEAATALFEAGPAFDTLKKNKKPLEAAERTRAMKAGCVWHFGGPKAKPCCAIWKAVVRGQTYFVSNTHRCFQSKGTLEAAIKAWHEVVEPSA